MGLLIGVAAFALLLAAGYAARTTRRLSLSDFGISLSLREAPRAIEQIDPHPAAWRAADLVVVIRSQSGTERSAEKGLR